jgi:hypothetical protein
MDMFKNMLPQSGPGHMNPALMGHADRLWKMLDTMAESDPEAYRKFIADQARAAGFPAGAPDLLPESPVILLQSAMATSTTEVRTVISLWNDLTGGCHARHIDACLLDRCGLRGTDVGPRCSPAAGSCSKRPLAGCSQRACRPPRASSEAAPCRHHGMPSEGCRVPCEPRMHVPYCAWQAATALTSHAGAAAGQVPPAVCAGHEEISTTTSQWKEVDIRFLPKQPPFEESRCCPVCCLSLRC